MVILKLKRLVTDEEVAKLQRRVNRWQKSGKKILVVGPFIDVYMTDGEQIEVQRWEDENGRS